MSIREQLKQVSLQEVATPVFWFLSAVYALYTYDKNATFFALFMSGVGGVLVWWSGYVQTNPRNHPKTPAAILEYVQDSPVLPPEVKAKVAPVLAAETVNIPSTKGT